MVKVGIPGLPAGGGGSNANAYADTIPGMAPSAEREGESPAKILVLLSGTCTRDILDLNLKRF